MAPKIWVNELEFSGGTTIRLDPGDVVLIVGPNNAGKSATLRAIRDKISNPRIESPVVRSLKVSSEGGSEDLIGWLNAIATRNKSGSLDNPIFQLYGAQIHLSQAQHSWSNRTNGLEQLGRFFCHMLTADERLKAADPVQAVDLLHDPLTHPIHSLQRDDRLEISLSEQFSKAFGADLIVNRNSGSKVRLHVGPRPQPGPNEDRASYGFIERLGRLPTLETQGDGMRSFAGVLLHTSVGSQQILLIDEPEAFLHPPQARLLGKMLVSDKISHRQLLVATHSGDVLRGVLDGNKGNVRVVRIHRDGDTNSVKELDPQEVRNLWTDPLLRASNILDGVFHERVIVSESDGDSRFFSAVADAMYEGSLSDQRRPDIMFTHCGGKDRLPLVVGALRALDVPVRAVVDFDILNNENPIAKLITAAKGDWNRLRPYWYSVKSAIDSIRPQLATADARSRIEDILATVSDVFLPRQAKKQIEEVLKQTSPWSLAKKSGKAFVPSGTPTQEYERLEFEMRQLGIYVVEVGELERFYPAVGGHGPAWVNEVLLKDLDADPNLRAAREFVASLLGR